jgi:hypothetical protein
MEFYCPDNHGLYAGVVNRMRRAGPGLISQAIHAVLDKTPTPLADGGLIDPQIGRDVLVLLSSRARSTIRVPTHAPMRRCVAPQATSASDDSHH